MVPVAASQDGQAGESPQRRQEPEVLAVPMDADQELVYGWLGLSPALLLDPVPAVENLVVRVVRPDADPEAVVEEARQQLAASAHRRRRRGRGGEGRNGSAEAESENGSGRAAEALASSGAAADTSQPPDQQDMAPILEITPAPFESEISPAAAVVSGGVTRRRRSTPGADASTGGGGPCGCAG